MQRTPRHVLSAALTAALLSGCLPQRPETSGAAPSAGTAPAAALAWEAGHPERRAWSQTLRGAITANLAAFDTAQDITTFCPRYGQLGVQGKTEALATLAVAIAKRESDYNPDTVFHEPPPLGVDSIGLFQLSYEDGFSWCRLDRAAKTLQDPQENIRCAVGEMARLVARDKRLVAPEGSGRNLGLQRYWSVTRAGSKHFLSEIRGKVRALGICKA